MKKISILIILVLSVFGISCTQSNPYKTDSETIIKGKEVFKMQCSACHNFKSSGIGPNLAGVTTNISYDWLQSFIKSAQKKIEQGDERSKELYAEYKVYMPSFNHLTKKELEAVLAYMNTHDSKPKDLTSFGKKVENPIPDTIAYSGKTLQLEFLLQVPATNSISPFARINKISSIPNSQRNFIHDLNGVLYELKENGLETVLEIKKYFKKFVSKPGLGSGFGSFAFHPEYAKNGLFYTSHTIVPDSTLSVDFSFHDSISRDRSIRWILTEWKHDDIEKTKFTGTKRELLSVDMVTPIHGMQEITFNPLSKKGEEDYGKLYISIGDGGSVESKHISLTQDKSKIWGSILRIDPLGNNSKNNRYGIPEENPFVNEKDALGEIWAFGFRNPHKITWDIKNGNMLASGIGQHQIEELNLIEKGKNYGWSKREGTFRIFTEADIKDVYPLDIKENDNFTYPVAQFDHDEAVAISGGYVYYGEAMPQLQGQYIFGSITEGRIFMSNARDFQLGKQTPIEELHIALKGNTTTLRILTNNNRVDFRIGPNSNGELFIFTKADGKVYRVIGVK
ncbi:MAG: PQQ-dependent sugar dehydrogenase [Flavobacteriaceae bacterium]|nr:PQQ-dependent sugar dehydrogenase [Flavobacteriaceae bacterium]